MATLGAALVAAYLSCYAFAMPCPVLAYAMCYTMSGTSIRYVLRIRYALSGTDVGYAATRCSLGPAPR
eukprot:3293617-Rhodomonas_salina.1